MLRLIAHECASPGNPGLHTVAYRRRAPFKTFDRARDPRLERIDRFACMLFQIQRRSLRFVQAMRKAVLGFVSCARQGFAGAFNLAKVMLGAPVFIADRLVRLCMAVAVGERQHADASADQQ